MTPCFDQKSVNYRQIKFCSSLKTHQNLAALLVKITLKPLFPCSDHISVKNRPIRVIFWSLETSQLLLTDTHKTKTRC
jgi:hypothetical protein